MKPYLVSLLVVLVHSAPPHDSGHDLLEKRATPLWGYCHYPQKGVYHTKCEGCAQCICKDEVMSPTEPSFQYIVLNLFTGFSQCRTPTNGIWGADANWKCKKPPQAVTQDCQKIFSGSSNAMAANVTSEPELITPAGPDGSSLSSTTERGEERGSQVQNSAFNQSSTAPGTVEKSNNRGGSNGNVPPDVQVAINAMKGKKGLTPEGTCGSVVGVPEGWKVGSTSVCALISFINLPCLACSSMSLEQTFTVSVSPNHHDSDFCLCRPMGIWAPGACAAMATSIKHPGRPILDLLSGWAKVFTLVQSTTFSLTVPQSMVEVNQAVEKHVAYAMISLLQVSILITQQLLVDLTSI